MERWLLSLVISLLAGVTTMMGSWLLIVPSIMGVQGDFFYQANLLAFDDFFDEDLGKFEGEKQSVGIITYQITEAQDHRVAVENSFEVRTIEGEQIISVVRDSLINSETWEFDEKDPEEKEGFLFAPPGIQSGDGFRFWHVSYDGPIDFIYVKETVIEGLEVYQYHADFSADQTISLTHLEGVPEQRGVNLDVSMDVWIEPITGWMVKYEDQAVGYFYDQETQKRIFPWNSFRNQYTKDSILAQVDFVERMLFSRFIFLYLFPLVIALFSLFIFSMRMPSRKYRWGTWGFIVVCIAGVLFVQFFPKQSESTPILIGISRWVPDENYAYSDNIQGFKDALEIAGYGEGEVEFIEYSANADSEQQAEIAKYFLEQSVDLVYSLTTPGTEILKEHIFYTPIVFSVVTYPVESGIVHSLKSSDNNLVGTRNWVMLRYQIDRFLEMVSDFHTLGFVHRTDESNSTIQLERMREIGNEIGFEVIELDGRDLDELKTVLETMPNDIDVLYSACDTLVQGEAEAVIIETVYERKLPSFSCNLTGPLKGDLMGVVADFYDIGRLAGEKAALILDGASPESLQTTTVTHPTIYINKTTAEFLGITIPQDLSSRAIIVE